MLIEKNVSLLPYNTLGIDAKTDCLIHYDSPEDLQKVLNLDVVKSNQILAVGKGSNLLFLTDFQGVILHSEIKNIRIIEETENHIFVEIGSGMLWDKLVEYCVNKNWFGIENLSHIPGQVGAAAVQNIGAYGVEIKDVLTQVNAIEIKSGKKRTFSNAECKYDYRDSIFKNKQKGQYIVCSIVLRLGKKENYSLEYQDIKTSVLKKGEISLSNIRETIIETRDSKIPLPEKQGNAGSFFKNPIISKNDFAKLLQEYPTIVHYPTSQGKQKISAAWLIDRCGWKGKKLGKVGTHPQQALVIVNLGNAKANEVADLAKKIQKSVKEKFNISLEPEVNYITCKS